VVNCDHTSGSTFPIGDTTVHCSATDADDTNSPATGSFTVTVRDTDLALTGVPANFGVDATSPSGAVVNFTAPTVVDEETPPVVNCDHTSGSTFPIGDTTVHCSATDADDTNSPATGSFTVTVRPIQDVKVTLKALGGFSSGHTGTYLINVINTGKASTSGTLTVTDTLPPGLKYTGAIAPGWTCHAVSQIVTCTSNKTLPPGGSTVILLSVKVNALNGTSLTDTATVTPTDATPLDNQATVTLTVGRRDHD